MIGFTGMMLSIAADHIGLSLSGGMNGWGIMNTTGTLCGIVLILAGTVVAFKFSSKVPEGQTVEVSVSSFDDVFHSSTIPTIIDPHDSSTKSHFRTTQINIEEHFIQPFRKAPGVPVQDKPAPLPGQLNLQQDNSENDIYSYECPTCGTEIKENEIVCQICGEDFE